MNQKTNKWNPTDLATIESVESVIPGRSATTQPLTYSQKRAIEDTTPKTRQTRWQTKLKPNRSNSTEPDKIESVESSALPGSCFHIGGWTKL